MTRVQSRAYWVAVGLTLIWWCLFLASLIGKADHVARDGDTPAAEMLQPAEGDRSGTFGRADEEVTIIQATPREPGAPPLSPEVSSDPNYKSDAIFDGDIFTPTEVTGSPQTLTLNGPGPHHIKAGLYTASIDAVDGLTINCDQGAVFHGQDSLPYFVQGSANNVTIDGCEVRNYASPSQNGAINAKDPNGSETGGLQDQFQGKDWTVTNSFVHSNAGVGVLLSSGGTLARSRIFDNGELGCTSHGGTNIRIIGNKFRGNGHANAGDLGRQVWESGGCKLKYFGGTVHGNSFIDTVGTSIWCDIDCDGVWITGNDISGATNSCIFYEISDNAVINNNRCTGAGALNRGWFWEAGIQIAGSANVKVTNNTVSDSFNGITVISQDRTDPNTGQRRFDWHTENVSVSGNTISGCQFSGVAWGTTDDPSFTDPDVFNRVFWANNKVENCMEVLS